MPDQFFAQRSRIMAVRNGMCGGTERNTGVGINQCPNELREIN
jgi:hypothetical protein